VCLGVFVDRLISCVLVFFSQGAGSDCSNVGSIECSAGLFCDPNTNQCAKPPYHLLLGSGSVWGPACIPSVYGPSCICNFGTSSYQQLKESSISTGNGQSVYGSACPQRVTDITTCITKNGCSGINTGADTCFRNKCYQQYEALYRDCLSVSGYPFCGANSLIVMFLLVILALLIN